MYSDYELLNAARCTYKSVALFAISGTPLPSGTTVGQQPTDEVSVGLACV